MQFNKQQLDKDTLISLYKSLVYPRLIEEKMLILLRQGKISKWFSGIGQEAIAVGATCALQEDEYVLPMHRNLGVFTSREVPFSRLLAQFLGRENGFTKGRDRSFHFGTKEHHIVGMISHLGAQLGVADGIALACSLQKSNKVTLVFSGDGGSSEGDFHEALNVAAVWNLPVIFIIENNGYGLSTPNTEQFRCNSLVDKGIGYGMEAVQIDGNNILEVYLQIQKLASDIRKKPRPVLVEALTFRVRGHEEASGTWYVPKNQIEQWADRDPVKNFENFLLEGSYLVESDVLGLKKKLKTGIDKTVKNVFGQQSGNLSLATELQDVFSPYTYVGVTPEKEERVEVRFIDAISEGLYQSMQRHTDLVLMGQDIAGYGGAFKVTNGFVEEFGAQRVRNTPLCESAIVGAAFGLSVKGVRSMVEMQFADFVSCAFNQIVNNLAKAHYRWGQQANVVIRMPTGAGGGAGPFHSQSTEAWFFHVPGLKIVYPSNPYHAKGLLCEAFNDPNPILFFEHKLMYRSVKQSIPTDYYTCPIGEGSVVHEGREATVVTYGMGVHWALEIVENQQMDVEIIDLISLMPWDKALVEESVKKTNKVIILHEDGLTGGIGAEISAWISEHCFQSLDAPVMRVGALDTPVPFASALEKSYLPSERFEERLNELLEY